MVKYNTYYYQQSVNADINLNMVIGKDESFRTIFERKGDPRAPDRDLKRVFDREPISDDSTEKKQQKQNMKDLKQDISNKYKMLAADAEFTYNRGDEISDQAAILGGLALRNPALAPGAAINAAMGAYIKRQAAKDKAKYNKQSDKALTDPIVIDLDGDGLELKGIEEIRSAFDVDGDGFIETIRGVSPDDGILVYDEEKDGIVSKFSEITFSSGGGVGPTDLDRLSAFDSNKDGIISRLDAEYSSFGIWIDVNSNGISDYGEIFGLSDLGIEQISLTAESADNTPLDLYWEDANEDGIVQENGIYENSDQAPLGAIKISKIEGGAIFNTFEVVASARVLKEYSVGLDTNLSGAAISIEGNDVSITYENGKVKKSSF